MYFQIAITLVCMVSYVNPVHLFIWVLHLHLYLCLLILTMALFMGHFIPPFKAGEGIVFLSVCISSFVHLFAFVSLTFHLQ